MSDKQDAWLERVRSVDASAASEIEELRDTIDTLTKERDSALDDSERARAAIASAIATLRENWGEKDD